MTLRRVTVADAVLAARALAYVPGRRRLWVLFRMVREAEAAALHLNQLDALHPVWGDGSLMAVALRRPRVPEPVLGDRRFLRCLRLVLAVLD
ncbi:MAG: hypothetical protein AAGA71_11420 [Pseudomonadota bacterium]